MLSNDVDGTDTPDVDSLVGADGTPLAIPPHVEITEGDDGFYASTSLAIELDRTEKVCSEQVVAPEKPELMLVSSSSGQAIAEGRFDNFGDWDGVRCLLSVPAIVRIGLMTEVVTVSVDGQAASLTLPEFFAGSGPATETVLPFESTPPTTPVPTTAAPPPTTTAPTTTSPPTTKPAPVYYANCDAVRAAGAAPIKRGDPGYSSKLDRDGDGIGCG